MPNKYLNHPGGEFTLPLPHAAQYWQWAFATLRCCNHSYHQQAQVPVVWGECIDVLVNQVHLCFIPMWLPDQTSALSSGCWILSLRFIPTNCIRNIFQGNVLCTLLATTGRLRSNHDLHLEMFSEVYICTSNPCSWLLCTDVRMATLYR